MTAISLQRSHFDATAPLARANPVAKLAASTVIAFGLLLSVDVVTAGTALALELLVLPLAGLTFAALVRRSAIVLLGAVPAGLAAVLFGVDSGATLVDLGPISITQGSLASGVAISLRILAIGLPGIILLSTTDPTDLADGLAQVLRLPSRVTLAALAATRLFGVMAADWRSMSLARRARGLGGDGPVSAARSAFGKVFALLVLAIRRATVLATTMESRGFGTGQPRTWARESRLGWLDAVVVAGALLLVSVAIAAGVAAGTWQLLLS
ncbi:energy-coupling factor transporter transmembrane component T family protein [Angustibacter sp. McL0619]|uniref:energy-coupling factor transporter transmembrane component T family protein n=1 Tax=Angustibacter sp. McL0619 TaxID=3415676 RepID=UPI003CE908B3